MAWWTRVGDTWRSTDDLTLVELEALEKTSGVPWALLNPHRDMAVARSLLTVWRIRDGATDEQAKEAIEALTGKTLKATFQWRDDDDLPDEWEDGLPVVSPKADESTTG